MAQYSTKAIIGFIKPHVDFQILIGQFAGQQFWMFPCKECYIYTPANGVWGGGWVYRNHPVCLSVCSSVQSKLHLDHNFLTKGDKALILHKCIPCDKTFLSILKILTSWPWPWLLTYFWKKLNLGHNFWTKRDRAFIFHMCIAFGKTFLLETKFFNPWPWPWFLTYFWKNLTLTITFEPKVIGL